ncbi:MAG: sigma-54 dependent transcriptional regulator [Candidatus Eisenbacteria bacterium]|uniref:Sigma-54 dependent transcriptional regulator n=1 Tax=Eiseniibacteriota bacterium TaxID=2212470 RepID=A0A948W7F9_UNCEI|nr:sigma-54 dependent transcriptional regulator [Candidatus Eisenbacteria bacterium]MBU1949528.1 sigma-54 dependent transcriptional regulator [Candidatus Eisenbacteria bacterium]MBU2692559.1 sigma-54 dependent transcriptional regulator [Candidatus Eisenbacteria bacterium]
MEPTALILTNDKALNERILTYLRPHPLKLISQPTNDLDSSDPIVCDLAIIDLPGLIAAARWVPRIKAARRSCQIILMTPGTDPPNPEELESWGVRTWLGQPVDQDHLLEIISRGVRSLMSRMREGTRSPRSESSFKNLIGEDPAFLEVLETARKAGASSQTTVLIRGNTGTGKQLFARAIHEESPRSGGPFLDINCGSLPVALLESELFGHEKGAFTGATHQKPGLLELANGGTVFLDEIGELEPTLQVRILKFLDQRSFRRVQGLQEIQVDVRLVAATHRDLESDVRRGLFREDLYHRLNVLTLRIPSLVERRSDISLLVEHFTKLNVRRLGARITGLSERALETLVRYPWPGNVRELENVIERCVLLHKEIPILDLEHLPIDLVRHVARNEEGAHLPPAALPAAAFGFDPAHPATLGGGLRVELPNEPVAWDDIERAVLNTALLKVGGNISEAARQLKMGRGQLRYRLKRLEIELPGPQRYRPRRRSRRRNPQPRVA